MSINRTKLGLGLILGTVAILALSTKPYAQDQIIADVHMHPHPANDPTDVLAWMDRNNVQ